MSHINTSELRQRFSGHGKTKRAHVDSQTRLSLFDELWRLGVRLDYPKQFATRPSTDLLTQLVLLARRMVQR